MVSCLYLSHLIKKNLNIIYLKYLNLVESPGVWICKSYNLLASPVINKVSLNLHLIVQQSNVLFLFWKFLSNFFQLLHLQIYNYTLLVKQQNPYNFPSLGMREKCKLLKWHPCTYTMTTLLPLINLYLLII